MVVANASWTPLICTVFIVCQFLNIFLSLKNQLGWNQALRWLSCPVGFAEPDLINYAKISTVKFSNICNVVINLYD